MSAEPRLGPGAICAAEQAARAATGSRPDNLHLVFANAPELALRQREYASSIAPGIDPRVRELVTLEVSRLLGNAYCWAGHVRPALSLGFTEGQLGALRLGDHQAFEPADRELLAFVGAVEAQSATDAQVLAMQTRLGDEGLVRLVALIGFYGLVSRFQSVVRASIDHDAAGIDLDFVEVSR